MKKKVLIRTAQKLGIFFAAVLGGVAVVEGSWWLADYLFGQPLLGSIIIVASGTLSALVYHVYQQAKSEVEYENKKLIQELTKHG